MPNSKHSTYRGYCITTQWTAVPLSDRRRGIGFGATFAVRPMDPAGESWQQFPRTVFASPEAAEANALGAARKSIDDFAS